MHTLRAKDLGQGGGWGGGCRIRPSAELGWKLRGPSPGSPARCPHPSLYHPMREGEKGFLSKPLLFSPKRHPIFPYPAPKGCCIQPGPRIPPGGPPRCHQSPAHGTLSPRSPLPYLRPMSPPHIFFSLFLNNPRGAASYGRGGEHHELPRTGLGARAGDSTRRGGGGEPGSDTGAPPPWEKCPLVMGGGTQQNPHQTCPFVPLHLRVPPYPTPPHRSV